jgi:hypothetical protein
VYHEGDNTGIADGLPVSLLTKTNKIHQEGRKERTTSYIDINCTCQVVGK